MQCGDAEVRISCEQLAEARQVRRLVRIVGLFVQLRLGVGQHRVDVELGRQQPGELDQRGDIVDIAVDALAHAGILHLDRKVAPVECLCAVHLADRGGGDGPEIEAGKALFPAATPVLIEHIAQLALRHVLRIGAQPAQYIGQLGRKEIAGVHRHQLAQLHRRAAHRRQPVSDLARVGGGEQQVADRGTAALRELLGAIDEHRSGDAADHGAEAGKAGEAAAGDGLAGRSRSGGEHRGVSACQLGATGIGARLARYVGARLPSCNSPRPARRSARNADG